MSFFGKKPRTAQQKAQWAKTRVMFRGIALLYLVFYIIVPMLNPDVEDVESMHPALRYGILVFFIVVCTFLIITTIVEYYRSNKAGLYKPEAYTDDEGIGDNTVTDSGTDSDSENEDDEDEDYDDEDEDDYYDEDEEDDD